MTTRRGEVVRLAVGFLLLGLAIAALHVAGSRIPGAPGGTGRLERTINPAALFYTEVGDVREFLDRQAGRYGGLSHGTGRR